MVSSEQARKRALYNAVGASIGGRPVWQYRTFDVDRGRGKRHGCKFVSNGTTAHDRP